MRWLTDKDFRPPVLLVILWVFVAAVCAFNLGYLLGRTSS